MPTKETNDISAAFQEALGKTPKADKVPAFTPAAELTPLTDKQKWAALAILSKELDVSHKTTNSLIRLGSRRGKLLPSLATGLYTFDYQLIQTGGVPKGRIVEFFGPESSGKTSIALHVIAECQAAGGIAAFVDAEHALDPNYAVVFGVDIDKLLVSQPDCGEDALDTVEKLVDSRCVDLIVVDSVSALVPRAELEGEMGDVHMGLQARLMSQAMRKLVGKVAKTGCIVLFINQIREKIGTMYGNPETTSGGRALKFYASIRIDVRRQNSKDVPPLKDKAGNLIGHTIKLKGAKNKCGVPFIETFVDLYYTTGFDKEASLIEYANHRDLFKKNGSWFQMDLGNKDKYDRPVGYENVANGLPAFIAALKEDPELMTKVKAGVQKALDADAEAALS
jgi:recombination protein RecA